MIDEIANDLQVLSIMAAILCHAEEARVRSAKDERFEWHIVFDHLTAMNEAENILEIAVKRQCAHVQTHRTEPQLNCVWCRMAEHQKMK